MRRFVAILTLLGTIFSHSINIASAQDNANSSLKDPCTVELGDDYGNLCDQVARFASVDQAVPDSPAFTILGVSPETVIQPTSPDEVAISLLDTVDPNGNFQTGVAIDMAPYMVYAGDQLTLREYDENWIARTLANTQLSIATTKGTDSNDKSARLAVGLHVTPWVYDDPRLNNDLLNCLGDGLQNSIRSLKKPPPKPSATEEEKEAHRLMILGAIDEGKSSSDDCRDKFQKKDWNSAAWTLGITPAWTSDEGNLGSLSSSGFGLWSSFSLPVGTEAVPGLSDIGQTVIHLRYRNNERIADNQVQGQFFDQDSWIMAGKLQFSGPTFQYIRNIKFGIEGAYIDASRDDRDDDSYYQLLGKLAFRLPELSESIWFDISFGGSSGRAFEDNSFGGISFKWGYNDKSLNTAIPQIP